MGVLLTIALMCVQGVSTTPQAGGTRQAFSGTWLLDPARSILYSGGARQLELVVVEDESTVKVTDRRRSGEDEYSIPLDGKPHEHTAGGGRYLRALRRDNGALVFQIAMTRLADNASISYTERWYLSDGGRTLTIHTAYPGGRDVVKVFARKD